jgi:predicted ABC-type ATPase
LRLIRRLKKRGYKAQFFFLSLPAVELALTRIGARVSQGGHDIPESVVRRRFGRSIQNFLVHYRPLADKWILFDNSGAAPAVVALEEQRELRIMEPDLYAALLGRYGRQ